MVKISYDNLYARCEGPPEELSQINLLLTYSVKGARYAEAYKKGRWNGRATMFNTTWRYFPVGLLHYVMAKLPHIEFECECIVQQDFDRAYREVKLLKNKLRDYQAESVSAFLKKHRGIVRLSTRSGKSVIGIACTQAIWEPTLFVVHTKDLLSQTIKAYEEELGIRVGKIGDGFWEPDFITVATVQTLSRGLKNKSTSVTYRKFLESRRLVIFDEVHRASNTYQQISKAMPNAEYRLGLSATALIGSKENKFQSMALTGPIIYEVKTKKLLDDKYIAKPIVTFIDVPWEGDEVFGMWDTIYDQGIVNNEDRNYLICFAAVTLINKGLNPLILVEKKEHGEILEQILNETKKAKYVHGGHTSQERKRALDDLQIGNLDAVISTRIFNEGINIVNLKGVIIASGYKAASLCYQRYGRGITRTPDKEVTYIIDFIDNASSILYNHSMERMAVCRKDKAFELRTVNANEVLEKWGVSNEPIRHFGHL